MEVKVVNLENKEVGKIKLNKDVFGLEVVRPDLIKRVVDWQRAKAMAGTHKTKNISEISGTTKKPFKQKGTGNARQGSLRSVQMRGGAVAHGPRVRSHAIDLPKKVRRLGLRHALSEKMGAGKLFIIDSLKLKNPKTSEVVKSLSNFKEKSFFIIGDVSDKDFIRAAGNLHNVNIVPHIGANVYDIIKHDCLIITKDVVQVIEARL